MATWTQAQLLWTLADCLRRLGVEDAFVSPGYRNWPLMRTLNEVEGLRMHSVIDERSAGFAALGACAASGTPTLLSCTSGTAPAHYLPAMMEAYHRGLPLMVLSADRPEELQRLGAQQATQQANIFKPFTRLSLDLDSHPVLDEDATLTAQQKKLWVELHDALMRRPGPVHLNLRLRKPFEVPLEAGPFTLALPPPRPAAAVEIDWQSHGAEAPTLFLGPNTLPAFGALPGFIERMQRLESWGWRIVQDVASGLPFYSRRVPDGAHLPDADLALWFGEAPIRRDQQGFLRRSRRVIRIEENGQRWQDPWGLSTEVRRGSIAATLSSIDTNEAGEAMKTVASRQNLPPANAERQSEPEDLESAALARVVAAWPGDFFFGNSALPRRLDRCSLPQGSKVFMNRGLNGIDGNIATSVGLAIKHPRPLMALIGDVATAHDLGALLNLDTDAVCWVVVDNGGGRIFERLPTTEEALKPMMTTPTGLDWSAVALAAQLHYLPLDARAPVEPKVLKPKTLVHLKCRPEGKE